MSNISWNASSLSSYFKTSLGNKTTAFDSLYSSLSDASMIKSGSYKKLMKSYYATLKEDNSSDSDSKTNTNILDKLKNSNSETKVSNSYLDDLLSKNYNSDGTKKQSASSNSIDTTI